MDTYELSFDANGEPLINGEPYDNYGVSSGNRLYNRSDLPFTLEMDGDPLLQRGERYGPEIMIEHQGEGRPNYEVVIGPAALAHLQANEILLSTDDSPGNSYDPQPELRVPIGLTQEAADGLHTGNFGLTESGNTIVIAGQDGGTAYFPELRIPDHGSILGVSAEALRKGGVDALQERVGRVIAAPDNGVQGRPSIDLEGIEGSGGLLEGDWPEARPDHSPEATDLPSINLDGLDLSPDIGRGIDVEHEGDAAPLANQGVQRGDVELGP